MRISLLVCLAGLLCGGVVRAEELAAEERLYELLRFTENGRAAAQLSMEPSIQQMKARGYPQQAIDEIRAAANEFFNEVFGDPEMKRQMLELYQKTFTQAEMHELISFYTTPTGRKSLEKMPLLVQEGGLIGQRIAARHSKGFEGRMQKIAQKYQPVAEAGQAAPAPGE